MSDIRTQLKAARLSSGRAHSAADQLETTLNALVEAIGECQAQSVIAGIELAYCEHRKECTTPGNEICTMELRFIAGKVAILRAIGNMFEKRSACLEEQLESDGTGGTGVVDRG